MRYRKLPVEVEAFQLTRERMDDNGEWPSWLHEAWNREPGEVGSLHLDPKYHVAMLSRHDAFRITTLENSDVTAQEVTPDDWIIRGVIGEIYPCKPNVFEMTYEPVEEPPPST